MTGLPAQPTASVQPAVPAQFQTFLAFDFGLKRTGVASGNRMLRTASPQATIKAEGDARFAQVAQRIRNGSPTRWSSACPTTPTVLATKTRSVP
jgi:putative Holliday junction resolvase